MGGDLLRSERTTSSATSSATTEVHHGHAERHVVDRADCKFKNQQTTCRRMKQPLLNQNLVYSYSQYLSKEISSRAAHLGCRQLFLRYIGLLVGIIAVEPRLNFGACPSTIVSAEICTNESSPYHRLGNLTDTSFPSCEAKSSSLATCSGPSTK